MLLTIVMENPANDLPQLKPYPPANGMAYMNSRQETVTKPDVRCGFNDLSYPNDAIFTQTIADKTLYRNGQVVSVERNAVIREEFTGCY